MEGKEKMKEKWARTIKKPGKKTWIFMIVAGWILSCCYLYTDMPFTTAGGLNVWTSLFDGKLALFYSTTYPGVPGTELAHSVTGGAYDFLIYVIFAMYNFPIWIWEKITGLSFISFIVTKVYVKGIAWVFSGISAYLVYKIALESGAEKKNAIWAPFFFLTSGLFWCAQVTIVGYDVISTAFGLLGVYGYLKKNKVCFYIGFAVGIATKMFVLWLFIPLLLLQEKKIYKIIGKLFMIVLPIVIPKLYFSIGAKYAAAGEPISKKVNAVIAHSNIIDEALFPSEDIATYTFVSMPNLPLLFVGMFAVWVFCYLVKRELTAYEVIYLCTFVMAYFTMTVKMHPYWCILLAPYIALLMAMNTNRVRANLLLDLMISVGYVCNKAILYFWCLGLLQIHRMIRPTHQFSFEKGVDYGKYGFERLVYVLSEKIGISELHIAYIFSAVFVAGMVGFLIVNRPGKADITGEVTIEKEKKELYYLRLAFSLFVGILPMLGLVEYVLPVNWGA